MKIEDKSESRNRKHKPPTTPERESCTKEIVFVGFPRGLQIAPTIITITQHTTRRKFRVLSVSLGNNAGAWAVSMKIACASRSS